MKCLNCSFTNPPDARFCQNCGTRLETPCPTCGTANPPEARFCASCGKDLAAGDLPSGPAQPKATAGLPAARPRVPPPNTAEKARIPDRPGGERRVVTALFADVVDSTALAEQMDPEDWTAVMNRAFDALTAVILRYEGTVARLMGDAVLAFFGAPVAHEDDPLRAARAALELIEAARAYAEEVRPARGIDFAIRVGLSTGPVVAGEVGTSQVYEYTAMGDAVNLAARMQAAARPNTALMTEATYRQVSAVFDCADLGSIPVKGKAEPVHVYELLRPKSHPERLRGLQGSGGHLVGREAELSALLKAGNAVLAGLGRAALITGEPGIGKSRLVAEWKERLAAGTGSASGLRWAEGRCLSYGQGMAYHLLVDLLRSLVGIAPAAGDEDARATLAALCEEQFGSQAGEVFPYLAHLLALPLEGEASERVRLLDPQSLQARYLDSLSRLLRSFSVHGPLGIVLDDIHWADPSSVDLLIRLLPLTAEAPLLFCLITRPERDAPGWKLVEAAREQLGAGLVELELPPLTGTESQALASGLLENADLPDPVCDLILGKAEGNPLFVEEVIRMLIDRGFIRREGPAWALAREVESVDIPDNLQSLLLARIDHLPEEVKRTLRVAAVIGRQFSVRVLREVLRNQEVPA